MYTRTFQKDDTERIRVPENYDGLAFRENDTPSAKNTEPDEPKEEIHNINPWEHAVPNDEKKEESVETMSHGGMFDTGFFSTVMKKIPFVGGIFENGLFDKSPIKIGTEEILIIGVALFLFFSKSGDRECALMLLLLLFVN